MLAGAQLVGDSLRASLRDLVLRHLGRTDHSITATGFFREQLASGIGAPLIVLEGAVTHEPSGRRAVNVLVYGVDDRFFEFHKVAVESPGSREILLSEPLARELGATPKEEVLVRVERPSAVARESLHGRKENSGRTMRGSVRSLLSSAQMGEFSLQAKQGPVYAVYVPLRRMQRDLEVTGRINAILTAGGDPTAALRKAWTIDDLGLRTKPAQTGFALESEGMILNDAVVKAASTALPAGANFQPVFTYLANTIRLGGREIPYSLVAGVDLPNLPADGVVLNEWAARELAAKPGDKVGFDYYLWDPSGRLVTRTAEFTLSHVVPIAGIAADRELAPAYPGISDTEDLSDWDPPFPLDLKRVRPSDEEYWDRYRTTAKAFIPYAAARRLWTSRFGDATSVRVCCVPEQDFVRRLREQIDPLRAGFIVEPVKQRGLEASRGATDFGEYFLYFSFFLVVSALLLVSLFFRFGVEQRTREVGTLLALGFSISRIRRMLLLESLFLALAGGIAGIAGAFLYGWFVVFGLRTWWVDAVGTRDIAVHLSPGAAITALLTALLLGPAITWLTLRGLGRATPRQLLAGSQDIKASWSKRRMVILAVGSATTAVALLISGSIGVMPATGAFFGSGALLLVACLTALRLGLQGKGLAITSLRRLGARYAGYRPARTVLCVALIALATFLIVSVDSFRRSGSDLSGAAGYPLMAESALPLYYDPNTPTGKEELNLGAAELAQVRYVPFRLRPGDDASCLNLYQPRNPRVLGVGREFAAKLLLGSALEAAQPDGAIPAMADLNSLTYVLHKKVGDEVVIGADTGRPVRLRFVGALHDSVFQSELLISDENFRRAFPEEEGYRVFLIDAPQQQIASITGALESALSDFAFDVTGTRERLDAYHRVENTYLSTFQTLGALGLLLGTFGLAAVLLRNMLERRRELALLAAVGYRKSHLQSVVLAENIAILIVGVLIGTVCALVAVAPSWSARGGQAPVISVILLVGTVFCAGIAGSYLAVRAASRSPLLESLRSE